MNFELTDEFVRSFKKEIESGNEVFLRKYLDELHPADIAEIINKLTPEEVLVVYKFLDEKEASDVVAELTRDAATHLLESLPPIEAAHLFIENMDTDDAADVLSRLEDDKKKDIIEHIQDDEHARNVVDLLRYDENSAGGLMAKEFIKVNINWSIPRCIKMMREQAEKIEHIYTIYVVDDRDKLLGTFSLKKLLLANPKSYVADIYQDKVFSVKASEESEEVARLMEKYDLIAIPVVDVFNRLIGRITIDDVVDSIRKEETEDAQKMGGVGALEDPYTHISFFNLIRKRAGWLVILFIGETFTATAMAFFQDEIAKAVVLALFVPLIISSGGNTGSQASTIITRSLALGEVTVKDWFRIVKKEMGIGLILGLILGVIGFSRVALWSMFIDIYGPHWLLIAFVVGVSLVGVVLWGNLTGSILPIVLKRLGFDPAVSSAPFVATLVDVTGLVIYFSVALLFLRGVLL